MLTLAHIFEALTGTPVAGAGQVITDVVIDSRLAIPGSVFVALPGDRTDGHEFVGAAFAKGTVAALVQRDLPDFYTLDLREPVTYEQAAGFKLPVCLRVADSLAALQMVAKFWRGRLNTRVIGITGSVGKTTTKEIVAAVLGARYRTLKSEGNLNNEIGLPLSLLRMSEAHERAVLEMGFYEVGEIALLCDIAKPQVGVVNNIYAVHLSRAGSIENIAQGKGELVEALPPAPEGVAVLNMDEPLVMSMAKRTQARVFTYGLDPQADIWASDVAGLGLDGIRFQLHYPRARETLHIRFPMLGRHSVHTALRAAAVGLVEGLTWQEIVEGLQGMEALSQLRLYAVTGPGGSLILDDSYNASPESVIAALNLLDEMEAKRRVAVLGDMLELGDTEAEGHRLVGKRAADVADHLVTIGSRAELIADEALACGLPARAIVKLPDRDSATAYLKGNLRQGDVVLVKGSHGLRLDRLVVALEQTSSGV
ncbi:MAG TPA: UDP-N-acetylmuramoyl-tripeptide--D-alanyl-D-alanine ligase [Anaerolineales bacterium]|nr:UDP-N-acetylmuramoyl-tripeptide--D-alanyl-D-alanine ligase [Anaerolineales bacterium]HLF02067.1 UDP-N-acetylmuramoyl-tripeptide--D-alanyl-D-alanine ligase [Anaerolineales bacterium]